MTSVHAFAELLVRQATDTAAAVAAATSGATPDAAPACEAGNTYDGRLGIRVSAIFVILVTATLGEESVAADTHERCFANLLS